jgi:hypothetical protein
MSRKLGFEFMYSLVADMVQTDPSQHPNTDEAVQRLNEIVGGLSSWKLCTRVSKRPFRPYSHHRKNSGLAGCGSAVASSSWFTTLLDPSRPSASCGRLCHLRQFGPIFSQFKLKTIQHQRDAASADHVLYFVNVVLPEPSTDP